MAAKPDEDQRRAVGDREVACEPSQAGHTGAFCVGGVTDNSPYGDGLIDAFDAVS